MARAALTLPSMLAALVGGVRTVPAEGDTLRDVLEDAFRRHPELRRLVLDESGELRRHVLCFVGAERAPAKDPLDRPVRDGDRVTILQAVSGG